MRPDQFEIGLVVVEVPRLPTAHVMTILALGTQTALVYFRVIFFMARETLRLGIFKGRGEVALLAFHQCVVPLQQELGHGVVFESGLLPIRLVMASFALLTFLPLVLVVLLVT